MSLSTGYCICTAEKTKTRSAMSGKFKHNLRLHDVKNADSSKRHLNQVIVGEDKIKDIFNMDMHEAAQKEKNNEFKTYIDYAEESKWLVENATGRKVRKDAVLQLELVLTYSHDSGDIPLDDWVQANKKWLEDYFGAENLETLILHRDESTPHLHAMLSCIDRDSGTPKLNCKKWTGGKAALSKMQTSYAESMKQFGLSRGEQNTRAKHTDLADFYKALNNVVRQKLPQREQFQDEMSYQIAIDEIYRDSVMRMFALEQTLKRLEAVDKTRESNHSIYREIAEGQIKDYEEKIKLLESNLSEAEKKAKFIDNMQVAIHDIQKNDPDKAEKIRENLNNLSKKGGALERALARKAAQSSQNEQGAPDTQDTETTIEI